MLFLKSCSEVEWPLCLAGFVDHVAETDVALRLLHTSNFFNFVRYGVGSSNFPAGSLESSFKLDGLENLLP